MTRSSWLSSKPAACRPQLEELEARATPATFFVDPGAADGAAGSLRAAVIASNAGTNTDDDVIHMPAGTYALTLANPGALQENAAASGDLDFTSPLHRVILQGAGRDSTVLVQTSADRVVHLPAGAGAPRVVLNDLTLQGGNAQDDGTGGAAPGTTDGRGGGILAESGSLTLTNVTVRGSQAVGGNGITPPARGFDAFGGGIYASHTELNLNNVLLTGNQALGGNGATGAGFGTGGFAGGDGGTAAGGGLFLSADSARLSNCQVTVNTAQGGTAGAGGDATSGDFSTPGNGGFGGSGGSGEGGGVAVSFEAALELEGCTLAGNQVRGLDGGTGGNGLFGRAGSGGNGGNALGAGLFLGLSSSPGVTVNNTTFSDNVVLGAGAAGPPGSGRPPGFPGRLGGRQAAGCTSARAVRGSLPPTPSPSPTPLSSTTGATRGAGWAARGAACSWSASWRVPLR
jgi:hypothetical protein